MKYLLVICLIPIMIQAESLSTISGDIGGSSSTTSSSDTYYSSNEESGYNTEVHILDTKERFERVKFIDNMFTLWNDLYIQAQTFDLISQLKENGYFETDGTLRNSVTELNLPLEAHQFIDEKKIKQYYRSKYPTTWILSELKRVGIIDSDGYLTDTELFSDDYNELEFERFLSNIQSINYNFSSDSVSQEMGRELLRVIKESSLSIHVRQSETTRFQSRNESLVDNVFEQFFGNLIGDILFQDKVTTQKRKVHYSPNIDPYNLFSNIYTGFAKAPYIKNSTGDIVYFGQTKQRHAIFNYAQNESNIDLYGLEINFYKQALKGKQLGMKGINISGDMFQDSSDDTIGVYKLRAIGGTFDSLNNILFSFGLSYYADSISNKNQFGIGFGGSGSLTLYPHLAAYGFFDTNFGFNIFAPDVDRINWAFNKFGCGLETTFEMLKARLGYQWITGKDGTLIFQGYTSSLGIYF